jgi:hypothetical protein
MNNLRVGRGRVTPIVHTESDDQSQLLHLKHHRFGPTSPLVEPFPDEDTADRCHCSIQNLCSIQSTAPLETLIITQPLLYSKHLITTQKHCCCAEVRTSDRHSTTLLYSKTLLHSNTLSCFALPASSIPGFKQHLQSHALSLVNFIIRSLNSKL